MRNNAYIKRVFAGHVVQPINPINFPPRRRVEWFEGPNHIRRTGIIKGVNAQGDLICLPDSQFEKDDGSITRLRKVGVKKMPILLTGSEIKEEDGKRAYLDLMGIPSVSQNNDKGFYERNRKRRKGKKKKL